MAILLLSMLAFDVHGQYSRYIIEFTDKAGTPFNFNNPSAFLSAKAIARRNRFNISLDSTDLPVTPAYVDSLRAAGAVTILNSSKWLNQVLIRTTDAAALDRISHMPFVKHSGPIALRPQFPAAPLNKFNESEETVAQQSLGLRSTTGDLINYGNSFGQVHIHEGEYLHDLGFTGEGMTIAILDAGFNSYLTNRAFDSLRSHGQVLGTWDFVNNEASVNEDHSHGANCLSILSANIPGTLVGTAPKANYWLFRTEDAATEYPVEEQNWAAGAERADSLGADLITSSLGYSKFDDPSFDHTYADMNGHTTIVTRAADMAVKKGMIVTNSAGNEGSSSWKYILAPADGDSVLTVGAIDVNRNVAPFSSYGPTADGRVKPDISSVGWGTYLINTAGNAVKGNGTSYSNPNVAGLVTCLWQAFPEFRNTEIIEAVRKSSSQYATPDDRVGYGIPNFRLAHESLTKERVKRQADKILGNAEIRVYPNPLQEKSTLLFRAKGNGRLTLQLFDAAGKRVGMQIQDVSTGQVSIITLDLPAGLARGAYFLRYEMGESKGTLRLLK
jgi:serine protease AprX